MDRVERFGMHLLLKGSNKRREVRRDGSLYAWKVNQLKCGRTELAPQHSEDRHLLVAIFSSSEKLLQIDGCRLHGEWNRANTHILYFRELHFRKEAQNSVSELTEYILDSESACSFPHFMSNFIAAEIETEQTKAYVCWRTCMFLSTMYAITRQ